MKILHVYKDYAPVLGGIENHVSMVAQAQAAAGHDVTVLVTNPGAQPRREVMDGVRVLRAARLATLASTPLSVALPRLLRQQRPHITHLHFPYPVGELSHLLIGSGRTVITYHSDIVKQQTLLRLYRPLLRRLLLRADRIIATSAPYIASSTTLRPFAHKCSVVPLAVEPTRFAGAAPLLPPAERPSLLFVGRHRYYKGVDDLIRALPHIDARLLLGGDGPMRPVWQALATEVGVAERVHFMGEVSDADLPRLYASADLFVLPANARAEAFGMVLLEAMAAALPCVTTAVGSGTNVVVQDGVTGLVVPPRDANALATAVNSLLADPSLRARMGKAGQQRVRQHFTPQQMVQKLMRIYHDVLTLPHRDR